MASVAPVMVGLSGGVDSAVTALLLARSGRQVATLFMKNWEEGESAGTCPAEVDAEDARQVAVQLGLAFHARNFAIEYWDGVFEQFLAELRVGRTPNPDVLCNREVKFKTFVEHAADLGFERIATGHYARTRTDPDTGAIQLLRAIDSAKDQSYFLHALAPAQLAVAEFPIGELRKPQVRELAAQAGLGNAGKRDSTGICFIGERNFPTFIRRWLTPESGLIRRVDDGIIVGEHPGLIFFTLGQRGGLGIGGRRDGGGDPWFVVGKDLAERCLWVAQGDHPALYCQVLETEAASWISGSAPADQNQFQGRLKLPGPRFASAMQFRCTAKTRYRQPDQDCAVELLTGNRLRIHFDQVQRAVTPGQSVVLYRDEECLGGAVIAATDAQFGGL